MRGPTIVAPTVVALLCAFAAQGAIVSVTKDIAVDTKWTSANEYNLDTQVKVLAGATLTIQPGTMIRAAKNDSSGRAPALIITQGAKIDAQGTASQPITFTTQETITSTNNRGLWGGIVVCGFGILSGPTGTTSFVEGLDNIVYGGTNNTDNSRIFY
mmetsp:Transcript_5302/g.8025  ORF Transcript_5302/g.8025 Transcript_5302/m.8025 type:complete len:157 (-) Transcript_5302:1530-2000(-)